MKIKIFEKSSGLQLTICEIMINPDCSIRAIREISPDKPIIYKPEQVNIYIIME